jgi:hypothetical protein
MYRLGISRKKSYKDTLPFEDKPRTLARKYLVREEIVEMIEEIIDSSFTSRLFF